MFPAFQGSTELLPYISKVGKALSTITRVLTSHVGLQTTAAMIPHHELKGNTVTYIDIQVAGLTDLPGTVLR